MKQLCALLFSFFSFSVVFAATSPLPSVISPLASKSLLLDIIVVEKTKLVAVGEHGHILISHDGKKWQQSNVPVQSTLTSVYFVNDKLGWAVGHDGVILNTMDGGENWEIQQYKPELGKPFFDVLFKNKLEGIAVGAYGLIFRTIDGGKSWQSEFHEEFLLPDDIDYLSDIKLTDEEAYQDEIAFILPHFNRVIIDGRTLYLVGEIGLVAKSNDFGRHWQQFDEIYQGSFFDLARTSQGNLLVAGLRGHVFRSLENGTPWQEITTNTIALLNDIVLSDDDRIFIIGNNGMVLESNDDGRSYRQRIQKDGKALIAGVWFKNQIIAVSDVGVKTITMKPGF